MPLTSLSLLLLLLLLIIIIISPASTSTLPSASLSMTNFSLFALREESPALVMFHDPNSVGFKAIRQNLALNLLPAMRGTFFLVDAATESYLTFRYASELYNTWQEPSETAAKDPTFRFGKPNYFNVVVKVFWGKLSNGTLDEYAGDLEAREMAEYLAKRFPEARFNTELTSNEEEEDRAWSHLTPENSWKVMEENEFFLIVLLDPATHLASLRPFARDLSRRLRLNSTQQEERKVIPITWASAQFAKQFNVRTLPNMVAYDTTVDQWIVIYEGASEENPFVFSSTRPMTQEFVKEVGDWVIRQRERMGRAKREAEMGMLGGSRSDGREDVSLIDSQECVVGGEEERQAEMASRIAEVARSTNRGSAASSSRSWRTRATLVVEDLATMKSFPEIQSVVARALRRYLLHESLLRSPERLAGRLNEREFQVFYDAILAVRRAILDSPIAEDLLPFYRRYANSPSALARTLLTLAAPPDSTTSSNLPQSFKKSVERIARLVMGDFNAFHTGFYHKRTWIVAANSLTGALMDVIETTHNATLLTEEEEKKKTTWPQLIEIERRDASELTVEEFLTRYAAKRVPVVITGLKPFKHPKRWTMSGVRAECGNASVDVVKYKMRSREGGVWGGLVPTAGRLVDGSNVTLGRFIAGIRGEETSVAEETKTWYVHDAGVSVTCPSLVGSRPPFDEFRVPKYFAGDLFQRMPFTSFKNSWPSMFIGRAGTETALHVDHSSTSFFMFLVEGRKEWRVFHHADSFLLYEDAQNAFVPFFFDPFEASARPAEALREFPLAARATQYVTIQNEGELVFVPGGSPHAVRNMEDSIGYAMNVIDVTNAAMFAWDRLLESKFTDFEGILRLFPFSMDLNKQDTGLGEFKSRAAFPPRDAKVLDLVALASHLEDEDK